MSIIFFDATGNEAIRICTDGDRRIAELEAKNEEWEASFKLYNNAMRRGTKIWQDATRRTRIWPDAAQLVAWLIQRCDQLEKITKEYAEALSRIIVLEEDLDLHKKVRSAQANMITYLIKKNDQRFSDLQDEHLILHQENEKLRETLVQREMIWGGWTRRVAEIVVNVLTDTGGKTK